MKAKARTQASTSFLVTCTHARWFVIPFRFHSKSTLANKASRDKLHHRRQHVHASRLLFLHHSVKNILSCHGRTRGAFRSCDLHAVVPVRRGIGSKQYSTKSGTSTDAPDVLWLILHLLLRVESPTGCSSGASSAATPSPPAESRIAMGQLRKYVVHCSYVYKHILLTSAT